MAPEQQQYYLRADPTSEGRRVLRTHQDHLARVFRDLAINPRLTRADDLHWTAIFLGSPVRWVRALQAVGADVALDAKALLSLTLPQRAAADAGGVQGQPVGYDVLYTGVTNAVFVLRLHETAAAQTATVLAFLRERLQAWERAERVPRGTTSQLFRHPWFPLRRELNGGKPHITLARGRVSRVRQRDVLRTLRTTPTVSRAPITFTQAEIRIAGPAATSNHDA